jgi:hypothetical protein
MALCNNYKTLYQFWRWCKYYELDFIELECYSKGIRVIDLPFEEMSDLQKRLHIKYNKYIIYNYTIKNFNVSEDQIKIYDQSIREAVNQRKQIFTDHAYNFEGYLRSIFIENCCIIVEEYTREKLIDKIKKNIVYRFWWDEFTFEELSYNVIYGHFVKNTEELVGHKQLLNYFKNRFISKEVFIDYLLQNFSLTERSINEMNAIWRNFVVFDYGWLFTNEIKRSIRVFENECRYHFNEKLIGAPSSENILFRRIRETFGKTHKILSQGAPEWLTPQRFDIYFPELNIAVEYQGEQHFKPVDFGGKGAKIAKKQFQQNLLRDQIKKDKALANDCEIVYVHPKYNLGEVLNQIQELINSRIHSK